MFVLRQAQDEENYICSSADGRKNLVMLSLSMTQAEEILNCTTVDGRKNLLMLSLSKHALSLPQEGLA